MIPKVIHYCWFGHGEKGELIERCIASWKKTCPEFEIKEWNETNFDVHQSEFSSRMYREGRWAFVADYARLIILEKEGGIYLDTDMELIKNISPLLDNELLLGEESPGTISAGMVGATPHHPYIRDCRAYYDEHPEAMITIPRMLTDIFKKHRDGICVLVMPPVAFYPYSAENISSYKKEELSEKTFGVHHWNYSWGHPLNKFFKKIGVYSLGKRTVEILGLKAILKKILGFI
jgi:mannosyltransferase OCH1-like enzyme